MKTNPIMALITSALAIALFSAGIWAGATIATTNADRERETAVANAISFTLESSQTPLNCDDNKIIEAIKAMALNGAHVRGYDIFLNITKEGECNENGM